MTQVRIIILVTLNFVITYVNERIVEVYHAKLKDSYFVYELHNYTITKGPVFIFSNT